MTERRVWLTQRPGDGTVITSTPQLAIPFDVTSKDDLVTYHIRLPFLPPSKNKYDGWPIAWKSSCKWKWMNAVIAECKALQIPRSPRIGLAAMLVFRTNARRDPQNYSNCLWNFVPDALQKAGVILDDRAGAIDFGGGSDLGVKFAVNPRAGKGVTHLTMTTVEPGRS